MHGDGRGPSRAEARGSEEPGRGVGAPSRSGGGWRLRERDRERSQPLQLSPRAVRRKAAAALKAMNEGGKGASAPRSPERRPPPQSEWGARGPPRPGPWLTSPGLVPTGPQVGPAGGAAIPRAPPSPPSGCRVFAPDRRPRLVPLKARQPAGCCQWGTQAP